ncbi:hypothetical protein ACLKA7_016843 [Drosophila subpalustris]
MESLHSHAIRPETSHHDGIIACCFFRLTLMGRSLTPQWALEWVSNACTCAGAGAGGMLHVLTTSDVVGRKQAGYTPTRVRIHTRAQYWL